MRNLHGATHYFHGVKISHLFDGLDFEHLPSAGRSSRALILSHMRDTVQLDAGLEQLGHNWAREHYRHIGLVVSDEIMYSSDWVHVNGNASVFCAGEEVLQSVGASAISAAKWWNNKNNVMGFCWHKRRRRRIKTPYTRCYHAHQVPAKVALPVVVKAAVSAGGHDVFKCRTKRHLHQALRSIAGRAYQLQEWLPEGTRYFGLQYWVCDGTFTEVAMTEQCLDDTTYNGAQSPSGIDEYAAWQQCRPLAVAVATSGLEGPFNIDVALVPGRGLLVMEVNPRWSATTYALCALQRLQAELECKKTLSSWEYCEVPVGIAHLRDLNLASISFCQSTGTGLMVIDWGSVAAEREPTMTVLAIGDPEIRAQHLSEFRSRVRSPK